MQLAVTPACIDVSSLLQFGTPPGSDAVVRKIQVRPQGSPEDYWLDGLAAFVPTNWTSSRIDAYVLGNKASIRVVVGSKNFDGTVTFNQTSAPYEYSDVSPVVNGLIGASNFLTAGGESLTLQASGLSSTLELNVTVGVSPLMSQCTLLAIDGITKIDNGGQAAAMLSAQSSGSLLNDFVSRLAIGLRCYACISFTAAATCAPRLHSARCRSTPSSASCPQARAKTCQCSCGAMACRLAPPPRRPT